METLKLNDRKNWRTLSTQADRSTEYSASLSAAAIARGRALAADASYPPFEICQKIAGAILADDHSSKKSW